MLSQPGHRASDLRADLRRAAGRLEWSTFVRRVLPHVFEDDLLASATGLLAAPEWPMRDLGDAVSLAQACLSAGSFQGPLGMQFTH